MTYDELDFEDYEGERLHRHAVRALVDRHRSEYDELTGRFVQERIVQLETYVAGYKRLIAELKALNPEGINVPALTQTVNELAERNRALAREQGE